jgi:hypothetical protein
LVEHLHGKEGVDGSSPSEGFLFATNIEWSTRATSEALIVCTL